MANVPGDNNDNVLNGTSGDDTLRGYEGADSLYGGAGNDLLDAGGAGQTELGDGDYDYMAGGLGNDTYIVRDIFDIVFEEAGEGIDTVNSLISYTLPANVERLVLKGTEDLNGTGNDLINRITGNSGDNKLFGLGGNDEINGGAGNDQINGGTGADYMVGGAGDDTFYVDNTGDVVIELVGGGNDLVQSMISYTLGANVDRLQLQGTDALTGTGNELDNIIRGNNANNVITGGLGHDELYGQGGADVFVFGAPLASSSDKVHDFVSGEDSLRFRAADGYAGVTTFTVGFDAVGSDAQFVFDVYHNLYFDADGAGAGAKVLISGFGTSNVVFSDIAII